MKNYNLTKSVFAALLLVSTVVGADDKYPASDFQPKVVYQDEAAAKEAVSSATTKSSSAASSARDSQYPAANFEPKVLYSDSDYKHSAASPGSASSSSDDSSATASAVSAAPKDESSAGYLLGLIVLAVAGFVLFKKGAGVSSVQSSAPSSTKSPSGLTGVAKYLLKTSGTGVSRYLEKNAKNAPSAGRGGSCPLARCHHVHPGDLDEQHGHRFLRQ